VVVHVVSVGVAVVGVFAVGLAFGDAVVHVVVVGVAVVGAFGVGVVVGVVVAMIDAALECSTKQTEKYRSRIVEGIGDINE